MIINNQTCTKCINDKTVKHIYFDKEGVCNFCREYERMESKFHDWDSLEQNFLRRIKNNGHKYDAAVGFSGGKDSTYVLYQLVKRFKLKVKAFTLDNGFMSDEAKEKIKRIVAELGVEHEFIGLDQSIIKNLYNGICKRYLSPCLGCSFIGYALMINYASKIDAATMIHGRSSCQMLRNYSDLDNDYFKPFITEGLKDEMEDPAILMEKIICKIDELVDKELADYIKKVLLTDAYKNGFRPFVAYFLYHKYNKDEMIKFLEENTSWKVESEEEHFDCLIHHGALDLKNTIARRSHLMPEFSVMVREKIITRDQALKMAEESLVIDKNLAEKELHDFCDFAGLSYNKMMFKAKLYSKRWW